MMLKNTPKITVFHSSVMQKSQRSFPYIPGLLLIILGIAVVVAPKLVLGIAAAFIMAIGGVFCYLAYKLIGLRKQLKSLTKNFQSPFYGDTFGAEKPDIDITEIEEKKIILH